MSRGTVQDRIVQAAAAGAGTLLLGLAASLGRSVGRSSVRRWTAVLYIYVQSQSLGHSVSSACTDAATGRVRLIKAAMETTTTTTPRPHTRVVLSLSLRHWPPQTNRTRSRAKLKKKLRRCPDDVRNTSFAPAPSLAASNSLTRMICRSYTKRCCQFSKCLQHAVYEQQTYKLSLAIMHYWTAIVIIFVCVNW